LLRSDKLFKLPVIAIVKYPRHFSYLALAAVIELTSMWAMDRWNASYVEGLNTGFALNGLLHSIALASALTVRASWRRRVVFVAIAGVLSLSAPYAGLVLPSAVYQLVGLAFGSVFGAVAYWYLVRLFWIHELTVLSLVRAVILCAGVTVTWNKLAHAIWFPNPLQLIVHTLCWWLAFSFSLYLFESADSTRPNER
jgi:hypothetical protein